MRILCRGTAPRREGEAGGTDGKSANLRRRETDGKVVGVAETQFCGREIK